MLDLEILCYVIIIKVMLFLIKWSEKMSKKRTTIYINEEILNQIDSNINCSRSTFFEELATSYLLSKTDLEKIEQDIEEMESELVALQKKKADLEKYEEENSKNKAIVDDATSIVEDYVKNNGGIPMSNIRHIAKSHGLNRMILVKFCNENDYRIFD